MRRRALLASLAAGSASLAGCSVLGTPSSESFTPAPAPSEEPPNDRTDESPTREDDSERPEQSTSVIELETLARTYAFRPTTMHTDDGAWVALWFDRTETADHPARLHGWLENRNDFTNTFRLDRIPAVGRTHARQPSGYHHEARLHFAPTENNEIAETAPELERSEDGQWVVGDVDSWMPETYRLNAGERVTLEYELVGEGGAPGRPTGTYEFRSGDQTAIVAVWETDSPGPDDPSSFAGESVPAIGEDRSVQWYHDADATTRTFVRPSSENVELDAAIGFEFVNRSRESVECGHWNLHKLVDGSWYHVAPNFHTSDCRVLSPGAREYWTLRAFEGEAVPCSVEGFGDGGCGSGLTRGFLGGGTYAVVVGYGHPADESAALVELRGDQVDVVPTEGASAERDGDAVVVTTSTYGDEAHPPDDSFSLTRTDEADERLIAEQVMDSGGLSGRGNGLRDALAAFEEGVERVVVRADERTVDDVFGYETATPRFSFRGQAYEASRRVERE